MLVGFWTTFLIQHSAGLSGMPRRVYEYPDVGHLELYNLISTVGSFILAIGILATVANVAISLRRGAVAGPDPWRGNTLEWFTPSPPPVNNFDVVPRVRSVEPMKDIRRQIERQTRTPVEREDEPRPAAGAEREAACDERHAGHRTRTAAARQRAPPGCSPTTSR